MSDCIVWTGGLSSTGYGNTRRNGRQIGAHRAAFIDQFGPIPEGMVVCHRCDNRSCVNPEHLFLGTQGDNVRDAQKKGRLATGDSHGSKLHPERIRRGADHPRGNASLSPEDVAAIRLIGDSLTQRVIAARFGISQSQVSRILGGVRWEVESAHS